MTFKQKLYTVWAFFIVNMKRLFRDRLALFFTFLFPLIFLFVFGGLNSGSNTVNFKVAIINQSDSQSAKDFVAQLQKDKTYKIDEGVTTFDKANQKMSRGELDATIQLPKDFGQTQAGQANPSGQVVVHYTQNNAQAGQTSQNPEDTCLTMAISSPVLRSALQKSASWSASKPPTAA